MASPVGTAKRQALTVNQGDVSTTADYTPGIAVSASGGTAVTAGNVTTTGFASPGIQVVGSGPISVSAGSVSTASGESTGIYAHSSDGSVGVNAGTVTTLGDESRGIDASGTSVSVTAGSVSTQGNRAIGIYAAGYGAGSTVDLTVTGNVSTVGASSAGVVATADGDVAIHDEGTIVTQFTGQGRGGSIGIFAYSATGSITIDGKGSVTTSGGASTAVYATTNGKDIGIDLGSVTAYGGSAGIIATSGTAGNISVAVDDISTGGSGIRATGGNIDVTLNDALLTEGVGSTGIYAAATGNIAIHNKGSIATENYLSSAIIAKATGDILIDGGGSITAPAADSMGILAKSYGGSITIDQGNVTTRGVGVYAEAVRGYQGQDPTKTVNVKVGDVSTAYTDGVGVFAKNDNYTGTMTISTGNVSTLGDLATGIVADDDLGVVSISGTGVSTHGLGADGVSVIAGGGSISEGAITTEGTYADGIRVIASPDGLFGPGGDPDDTLTINSSSIVTSGAHAYGIFAESADAALTVNAGSVSTSGVGAIGIVALEKPVDGQTGDFSLTASGPITTSGNGASGVAAYQFAPGTFDVVLSGPVTTSGDNANGVTLSGSTGDMSVSTGAITTSGASSTGIYAGGEGNVAVKTGAITTAGDYTFGALIGSGGDLSVDVDSVSTTGKTSAVGLAVESLNLTGNSNVSVAAGKISTVGDESDGFVLESFATMNTVSIGQAVTSGVRSTAIDAEAYTGALNLSAQQVSTTGNQSVAIFATSHDGTALAVGSVSTAGDNATAIDARSASGVNITSTGAITTTGKQSYGIIATASDPVLALRPDVYGNVTAPTGPDTIAIDVATVKTSGDISTGIFAQNYGGDIAIKAGSVTTTGADSWGVLALGSGAIQIDATTVDSTGRAITAVGNGGGAIGIGIGGSVSSSSDTAILAINTGGMTSIDVGASGSVKGAGDGLLIERDTGSVSITNGGVITGGAYAIQVTGIPDVPNPVGANAQIGAVAAAAPVPGANIANSGTIIGAVSLSAGDDTLTNSGTFIVTKDSDFGAGSDLFVNSGTLSVQPGTKPGTVTMLGLEQFQNSGIIDMRNGIAGDTLTLPGSYIGSSNAKLGLDVGANGVADKLVVGGVASGTTSIVLNATASNATLIAKPITVVQAGTGTAANAFTVANQDVGFVSYGLAFNAASNSFQLSAQAGSAVHRLVKVNQGAQAIWHQSADAWSSHMAELRDTDDSDHRVWGQAYGQTDTSHDHGSGYNLGYRQDYYGGQAGVDLGGKRDESGNGLLFGVTGGYLSSHLNLRAGPERVRYDTFNLGGYASLRKGPLFVNLLGQYDHYRTSADNSVEHWTDKFSGSSYGAQAEVGARFGSDTLFAEPIATLAWQRADLGTLYALGQSLDFGHDTGLTGTIGGRFGDTFDLKGGTKAVLYAKATYVHEFKGKGGVLFESGGTSEDVAGTRLGDYGKTAIGVDILTTGRLSGFIEGDGDIGGSLKGGGGRAGIRFKL